MSADQTLLGIKHQQSEEQTGFEIEECWKFLPKFLEIDCPAYYLELSARYEPLYRWWRKEKTPKGELKILNDIKTKFLHPIEDEDVAEIINFYALRLDSEELIFLLPILSPTHYDPKAKVIKALKSKLSLETTSYKCKTLHCIDDIVKTQPELVKSYIPTLEQFPPKLLEVTRENLLSWLYGAAEIDMMTLHLGRAAALPQGAMYAGSDTPVEHSYRNVVILKGAPFVGKSFFNNWLIEGMSDLGLVCEPIHKLSNRFGHAAWTSSAWAYADDTTEEMISGFFKSEVLKTVASNGLINVESKGVNHITVKAMTTPILLANNIDTRHLAHADEGNANRIKIVASQDFYSLGVAAKNIPPESPLYGIERLIPAQIIYHLCNKYEVTPNVLCQYFLRRCLDYFNSFGVLDLNDKITQISADLYAAYNTAGLSLLAKAAVLSYLLKYSPSESELEKVKINFSSAGNAAIFVITSLEALGDVASRITFPTEGIVKNAIKKSWIESKKDATHPWMCFRNFDLYFLLKISVIATLKKPEIARSGEASVKLESTYNAIFSELRDVQGNPSQYSVSRVHEAWRNATIMNIDALLAIAKYVRKIVREKDRGCIARFKGGASLAESVYKQLATIESSPHLAIPDDYFDNIPEELDEDF